MRKRRLNFGIGRRDRASNIVRTMLEAFVPHKVTADTLVKLDFARNIFRNSKTFRLVLALAACRCCSVPVRLYSSPTHVMFSPDQQVRSLEGLLKITTCRSRNLFEVSCYNIITSYLW